MSGRMRRAAPGSRNGQKCGPGVKTVEDMEDPEPYGPPGCKTQLATWAAMPGLRGGCEEHFLTIECDQEDLNQATWLAVAEEARQ